MAFHQSRDWFEANRALYESQVKQPLQALAGELVARFEALRIPLTADPAKAMFRLHRDTRFSRDKHPYKTHAGMVLSRDGTKRSPGLLYLHVDPNGCFMAAGFYQPEPAHLTAIREQVRRFPQRWDEVVSGLGRTGLELGHEDKMKRLPRGFEDLRGTPHEVVFTLRHAITSRPLDAAVVHRPELADRLVAFTQDALPLLQFGWRALEARGA